MPAEMDGRAVTKLFPEIAKKPAGFLVRLKLHGIVVPVASYAFSRPTTVPAGALLFILKLLILIVIPLSVGNKGVGFLAHALFWGRRPMLIMQRVVYYLFDELSRCIDGLEIWCFGRTSDASRTGL
jgi:hypothetical protein